MEQEVEGERKEKSLKIQTNTTKAKTAKAKVAKFGRKGKKEEEEVIDGAAVSNFCF